MKLITISGLDGSGKTTQLDLIEKNLQKKYKVERFHMIDFSIANKILGRKTKDSKSEKPKAKTKSSSIALIMRKIAIIIDVFRFRFYYLVKNTENKIDYLLVDRYFYDQIINIKYLEKNQNYKTKGFWQKIVENQIITPDLKIYLKTKPTKIIGRDPEIEQGLAYLIKKNTLYNFFSTQWKLQKINGDQNKSIIENKIKQSI